MLTTMTESEWAIVLQVFRASRSRRVRQGASPCDATRAWAALPLGSHRRCRRRASPRQRRSGRTRLRGTGPFPSEWSVLI